MTSQGKSNQELIKRLKAGNSAAVEEWFHQYHDKVLSLVMTKVSSQKDAEELTQEIFLNCLKHLPLFRGDSSLWTWMASISRHEIADYYRKQYAKRALDTLPLSDFLSAKVAVRVAEETRPEVLQQKVSEVMGKMRRSYRELLLMKYVDGKKVKTIAGELGRTVKAVESDLFRARDEFRVLWAEVEKQYP